GRGDIRAIRDWAQRAVADGSWLLTPGTVIQELLMDISLPGAGDQAVVLCDEIARRFPGRVSMLTLKARVLIELSRDAEALSAIDSLPLLYRRREVLELRAWAAAHRGDLERAREIWKDILANCYFAALHCAEPVLKADTPRRRGKKRDGMMAIVPVRDEMANLPGFFAHYRRLGVRRFVVVDNGSTDGSDSYAKSQPDVVLYRTEDSFPASGAGMRWINVLIDRHAAGGWCLFADADEDLVYPGWETTPLDSLVAYLDAQGAEAMSAFMLDVYPERLIDSSGRAATRADCRYFDLNYHWRGLTRSPWRRPFGGIRARLFGILEWTHKTPLLKGGCGLYLNNHETTPVRLAEVTGALLHYKMVDLFSKAEQYDQRKPQANVADRILHSTRRYARYAARLKAIANMDLRTDALTQPLGDSLTLADHGLVQAPPHYRAWLNAT
ncbi:MAG TPA: glycosyltransferase family 2 protein, partial [Rhizomicrobium sp.]